MVRGKYRVFFIKCISVNMYIHTTQPQFHSRTVPVTILHSVLSHPDSQVRAERGQYTELHSSFTMSFRIHSCSRLSGAIEAIRPSLYHFIYLSST